VNLRIFQKAVSKSARQAQSHFRAGPAEVSPTRIFEKDDRRFAFASIG
jgi:hypothetical protein